MARNGCSQVVGRNGCILSSISMGFHRQFLGILLVLISSVSLLQAETITFDPPLDPGGAESIHNWLEHGMFLSGPNGFVQYDSGYKDVNPDNGSAYVRFASGPAQTLDFRFLDSTPFRLISVDLAEYSMRFAEPRTITIVGHKMNGAIVRQNVMLDGVMDGTGPLADFETFTFDEEFSNLSRVAIPTTRYAIDNVVVEPGAGGTILMGLEIIGPQQVFEGDLVPYEAVVTYGNGFELNVTTTTQLFVQPEDNGSFDANGILSTMNIDEPQPITLYTQYTEDAMRVDAELTVQVLPSRTFYVPSEYDTIQSAIDDANNGYVIIVEDGVYSGPGNRDIDFLGKAITVRSLNGPENCIIDCNGSESEPHRGFFFHSGEAERSIIDGLTIMNGHAPPREQQFGSSTSTYWEGGGILCYESSPTIANCWLINNFAKLYGGAVCGWGSSAIITGGTIENNMSENGGGISCRDGTMTVSHCIVRRNKASRAGGGLDFMGSRTTVANCLIIGNRASAGGGLSTGGWSCEPLISNCTISGNTGEWGGAVFCGELSDAAIVNSILRGNDTDNGAEIKMVLHDWGSSLSISYSDVRGANEGFPGVVLGEGVIDSDPCFVDPGHWDVNGTPDDPSDDIWIDGDYHLKSEAGRWDPNTESWVMDDLTSPCIDAGDPNSPMAFEPFPNGGIINVGAYGSTAEASRSFLSWSNSTAELNFRDYWPFVVGNKWREKTGYSFSRSWEVLGQLTVNGFDVWTIRYRSIGDHGGVVEERHYGYIDGGLYSTLNLEGFSSLPVDTESSLRIEFPEFIQPGIPIHLGEYGEVLPLKGTLEQILEVLNRSSNYTTHPFQTEHFPQGNHSDVLAFFIVHEEHMWPLAILGRDIGPMLLRDMILREVMEIEITNLENVNNFEGSAEVHIQVGATNLASDPIAKVEFYVDDAKVGEDVAPTDGWSYVWMNPPIGTCQTKATAVTHAGLTMDSQPVGITICDEPCHGEGR